MHVRGMYRPVGMQLWKVIWTFYSGHVQMVVPGIVVPVPLQQAEITFVVLQWARANGCAWVERTCEAAAYNGHLDILKWA
jgi:hypothetical protein